MLLDAHDAGLERGQNQILTNLSKAVKKKKYIQLDKERFVSLLEPTTDYAKVRGHYSLLPQLAGTDVVIEAVFEDLGLKHKVISQIEAVVGPETVIATNTSALPIAQIAAKSKRPDKVTRGAVGECSDRGHALEK